MSTLDPTKGGYASYAYELSLETLLKFGPNTILNDYALSVKAAS
jgi:hypothetical protein